RLYEARLESALPNVAAFLVELVDVLAVELSDALHEARAGVHLVRSEQQVHMVAHQAVRVQPASRAHEHAAEVEEIKRAIFVPSKTGGTVAGALDSMDRDPRKHEACTPWHAMSTDRLTVALTQENVVCP